MDELITVPEVAKILKLSPESIRNWAHDSQYIEGFNNNFPKAKKIGKLKWMWFKSEIIQWVHNQ